jgi:hypothetical protein
VSCVLFVTWHKSVDDRLTSIAEHFVGRLDGYKRYEDIPPGSKIAKRWSELILIYLHVIRLIGREV